MKRRYGYLKRRPRMKGINGLLHCDWLLKRRGLREGKELSIRQEEIPMTLLLMREKRNVYMQKICLKTVSKTKSLFEESEQILVKLKDLAVGTQKSTSKNESEQRAAFMNRETVAQLRTQLIERKNEMIMVLKSLEHHTLRVQAILSAKEITYLSGYNRASAGMQTGRITEISEICENNESNLNKVEEIKTRMENLLAIMEDICAE